MLASNGSIVASSGLFAYVPYPDVPDGDYIPRRPTWDPVRLPFPDSPFPPFLPVPLWFGGAEALSAAPTGYGYTTDGWGHNGGYGYTYTDGFGSTTDGRGNNRYPAN